MKQLYLTTLILFFSISLSAQNWQPFYANDEVHYTITDSGTLTNTIIVEKTEVKGGDSIYHFNTIIDKCDTCIYYKNAVVLNAPDFLGYTMTFSGDGIYKFKGKANFVIDANKGKGEDWVFDAANNVIASVLSIKEEPVLGELDSVKYIYLTSGKFLRLSKNHGITAFPYQIDGGDYEIYGIQNREIGEVLPTFKDYFNYKPGDFFEYTTGEGHVDNEYTGYKSTLYRFTIQDLAEEDSSHIAYNISVIKVDRLYKPYGLPPNEIFSNYKEYNGYWEFYANNRYAWPFYSDTPRLFYTILGQSINQYVDAEYAFKEAFQYYDLYVYDKETKGRLRIIKDEEGTYYKLISSSHSSLFSYWDLVGETGLFSWQDRVGVFYDKTQSENLYVPLSGHKGEDNCSIIYKEGVGFIGASCSVFESYWGVLLLGYSINGDTIGKVDNIQRNTSIEKLDRANISIYPNPASKKVTISIENYSASTTEVNIFSTSGQLVISKEHNFTSGNLTLDIANLPAGIYYVKVLSNGMVGTKKLIIN